MRAILQTLPGLIDDLRGPEVREAIVFAVWPAAIGGQLHEMSAPIRLQGKALFVAVSDAEWKREFKQHARDIVYRLNAGLKTSAVERLEFVIDPLVVRDSRAKEIRTSTERVSSNPISKDVSLAASRISDPDLRANFLKAAAASIGRRDAAAK
jgi:Dna[CI] antecedent, DciA